MEFNIEQTGIFQAQSKIICLSSSHFLVDTTLYWLKENIHSVYLCLASAPMSAVISQTHLLYASGNSLILLDLKSHDTCEKPQHKHLESQILLWKGINQPISLAISDSFAFGYAENCYLIFNLQGNLCFSTKNSKENPIESVIYKGKAVSLLNDQSIYVIDLVKQEENDWYQTGITSLGKGNKLLLGNVDGEIKVIDNELVDRLNINDILSEKEDELTIMSLYSSEEFIFVGFPLSFAILKHHELLKYFSLPSSAFTISFSDTHSLVAHSFESITTKYNLLATVGHDYLSDFEEESISEVNELQSVQSTDENTAIAAEIIYDVDQEITVTMNFEPKSKILNFSDKAKSNKPKKTKIQDKPVTFHKKIKSSGYGVKLKILKKPKNLLNQKFIYPKNTQAPSVLQEEHLFPRDAPLHNGPIFNVQYSRDAGRLATCGNDAAFIVKMPISKSKGERIPLVGHEGPINSITWSSECKYLLTSSSDSTAKMWNSTGNKPGECMLSIDGQFTDVKFYFVDKFIAASQGFHVSLYRYKLRDPFCKDDVKRLQAKCSYKEIHQMVHPSAQNISKFACHNSFHSHLMLFAGSNKVISVWDVDKDMEVMTIPTNHRKPIHTIRFYTGSDYVEPDHDGFNLFLTAACDNLINIYDIRSSQPVGSLLGHTNTGLSLGANISPCMRYIASGSEDRSAYIWDTRTNQIIQRLRGFRENTNDVAWNPMHSQLCVADNQGHIKFFKT